MPVIAIMILNRIELITIAVLIFLVFFSLIAFCSILISFAFLALAHIIDWRAPVAMVGTVALCSLIAGENVAMSLMTGGLMFGATFMVTDYATAPITKKGRLVFGFGCGLITFLIRRFGGYPEGVMFSILIMNSIAPFLNNLTARKYGYGKKAGRPANAAAKEAK